MNGAVVAAGRPGAEAAIDAGGAAAAAAAAEAVAVAADASLRTKCARRVTRMGGWTTRLSCTSGWCERVRNMHADAGGGAGAGEDASSCCSGED
jgi:hypothetical protein